MSVAVITGAGGLIGSEASRAFAELGLDVVGIDNDMRATFFGAEASTAWQVESLRADLGASYEHLDMDIRSREDVHRLFGRLGSEVAVVIHAAAQPSHDWAARDPVTDFEVNALGTLNLLEAARASCPDAPFIFTSTNKVYGDRPNALPLVELESRFELPEDHEYFEGIPEEMSIDETLHSLFGASKVAADVLVQEYGRYYDMPTVCFRGGTLTGPRHSATRLHGFLGYVMRCVMTGTAYTVYGYHGKQVRDAIHSADLVGAFVEFYRAPRAAAVYNIGGGRRSNASVLEAISLSEEIADRRLEWTYEPSNRIGDHVWWIGSNARFQADYPSWSVRFGVDEILREIHSANRERWS